MSWLLLPLLQGQLHLYATGCGAALSRVPYDQFMSSDYNMVVRDLQQYVLDAETQQPPHLMDVVSWGGGGAACSSTC